MATSPAPDAAAPPGMCPGIAVLGGGGAGGDGDGDGSGGKDGAGGGGSGSGDGAGGDGKKADGAPDPAKYPKCGTASHPVDVVTGRAFTHPITDLKLPGPLPLVFARMYSSKMADRDVGLGFGWGHSFGWSIEISRGETVVWSDTGVAVRFPKVDVGAESLGPWGWLLRRSSEGFWLDVDDGVFRRFEPADASGRRFRLATVEDRNRNQIAVRYDGARLAELVDSVGRVVRVRGTPDGRIAALEVKNAVLQGRWIAFGTYAYDDSGNLASATDADGFTARYAYDDDHRLTGDTDRTGLTFHFVYDPDGRCVESWGDYPGKKDPSLADDLPKRLADGFTKVKGVHHCRFDYGSNGYSEVADSTQVRRFFGNRHGTLDKSVECGGVMTATYRKDGHLLSSTDALGSSMVYERDARGRVLSITDPLGRVTRFDRDANGLIVRRVDALGGVTEVRRDSRGNALSLIVALGAVTTWRRNERGMITERIAPSGARTRYTYDAYENTTAFELANGAVYRFTYDSYGRRLSTVDPLGVENRYVYSTRGDLSAHLDGLGNVTRHVYDGERHLTEITDPKGHSTSLGWGGYHRLTDRRDANGNVVRLRYNLEGELVGVCNEQGEIHHLAYTTDGRLREERTFDNRILRYGRDLLGRVLTLENGAREVTRFEYDAAGQLVRRELCDGSEETYVYDMLGNLQEAKGPTGEFRFERDAVGRPVREAQIVVGEEHWTEIRYGLDGERVARATSLGHTEAVVRGPLGERARTLLDGQELVQHEVDALGRETARALSGGGWLQSQYDALGRLVRRRAGGVAAPIGAQRNEPAWIGGRDDRTTVDTAYRYDETGELAESLDQTRGTTHYSYDPIGQLLSMVPERARAEIFRYDNTGNTYEAAADGITRVYGAGGRLLRRGDTEYVWDDNGRLVERRNRTPAGHQETWQFAWNAMGLLRRARRPDGVEAEFQYDAFARRVTKSVTKAGATKFDRIAISHTRFVWDGDVLVHEIATRAEEAGDPIVAVKTYCFEDGGFTPTAHRENGEWYHYLNDSIGTPERLLDSKGNVACELTRKAWGVTEETPRGVTSTRLRFQGQYEDVETGLTYNRSRDYDADTGMFIRPDPIGLHGGTSPYRYAINPTQWVDPLGLANYTVQSDNHVVSHGHDANGPVIPGKSRFCEWEGGQSFTDEVVSQDPNPVYQANGRIKYQVPDLGRVTGTDRNGNPVRGGTVIVQGPNPPPGSTTTYAPNEVVTQYPT